MKNTAATALRTALRLSILLCTLPAAALAQNQQFQQMQQMPPGDFWDAKISPIALSANVPGLEFTAPTINRLATQSELNTKQLESLGLVAGGKLDDAAIRKVFQMADDFPARRFVDFFDGAFGKPQDRADASNWKAASTLEGFIKDAVLFGGFNADRERDLRAALETAGVPGDEPDQVKARGTAYRMLSEARQASLKTARGYRQLVDLLRRELEGREFVQNIGLVVEVRTGGKQPTLAPVSLVTMECNPKPGAPAPTLVFTQRKRDCNEQGVCRIESFADIAKGGRDYKVVFDELARNGRTYLDGCQLNTKMLIDGSEVNKRLPGRFTSHTAPSSK